MNTNREKMMAARTELLSTHFIWRRIHSLMGLWLVLYLIVHLIVNSQAVLWLGDDGIGFIRLVNLLEALPYLQVIETVFIGIPLVLHGYWGVKRIFSAKKSPGQTAGNFPAMPYERNRAFNWQRVTSWILLFGLIGHVVQMRFLQMPHQVHEEQQIFYSVPLKPDPALEGLAQRIDVKLVKKGEETVVMAPTPGKAMLFKVRETFKSPLMAVLYSIFVVASAFHAFNGFWTSLITWGALLSYSSQKAFIPICWIGVALLSFLGLAAIWGSYWLNLGNS